MSNINECVKDFPVLTLVEVKQSLTRKKYLTGAVMCIDNFT